METTELDFDTTTRLFQALSDETRLRIVLRLRSGEKCVCDLQEALGAYQSRLSFHLRKLKDAGLVDDRKDGRWVYYSLRTDALERMQAVLGRCCETEPWADPGTGCC